MDMKRPVSGKILLGSKGLGVADPDLLKKRAFEIAQIQERSSPDTNDWEEASRELHGHRFPEGTGAENARMEVEGEGVSGIHARRRPEDEVNIVEELVREGMEEAEHERMLLGHTPTSSEDNEGVEE
jgi:hypothetical protein